MRLSPREIFLICSGMAERIRRHSVAIMDEGRHAGLQQIGAI
jgi:hypothetical protein